MRGYFGIGIYMPKKIANLGTLFRSAYIMGANFIFTIGNRYHTQISDTIKANRNMPLFYYKDFDCFLENIPNNCSLICIEQTEKSKKLSTFCHPEQSIYLLGAEDFGIPTDITNKCLTIEIECVKNLCMNVSTAGSIVMYDRYIKGINHANEYKRNNNTGL